MPSHLPVTLCVALSIFAVASVKGLPVTTESAASQKLNVLFISIDDLRPELGCYGSTLTLTPNIDKLAGRSLTFDRAYCQYPVCNPSRTSLLTGLNLDTVKVYNLEKSFRETDPAIVSLPQLFKQNGYHTRSIGKIFHRVRGPLSDPESWSEPPTAGRDRAPTPDGTPRKSHGLPYESPDVADNMLRDGQAAEMAVEALRQNASRPFFLAVGFTKPHLPFLAPKKYWDRYDSTSIPLASYALPPEGSPPFAHNNSGELRQYKGIPKGKEEIPEDQQRQLKAGYLACVDYVDAQVGRLLEELDHLGLRDKTIIVLWSDHGYQLGEHGTWTKHTLWEDSARVPLIISDPAGTGAGRRSTALVELLDIYPTLTDMCGLEAPAILEGTSLLPLLKNPDLPGKPYAFTMFRKYFPGIGPGVGRSIRTDRYRFIEWHSRGAKDIKYYELYDLNADPLETINIATRAEHSDLVKKLAEQLSSHGDSSI